jgi:hypothetical protein
MPRIMIAVACLMLTAVVELNAQPQYTYTDLGPFSPRAIAGPWIVGQENGLPTRLNIDTGQKIVLGHAGYGGTVNAVLSSGVAVGTIKMQGTGGLIDAATFWDAAGQFVLLPGNAPSYASAINEAWMVAGGSVSCAGMGGAVRWWLMEGRAECLEQQSGLASFGNPIDGQHRVWGHIGNVVAVWEVGKSAYELFAEGGVQAVVFGDNEVLAVGDAEQRGSFNHLAAHFRFPPAITLLPTLLTGNDIICSALGINAASVTVSLCAKGGSSRAMFWPNTTTVVDLNTLVQAPTVLASAKGINDDGDIVGLTTDGWGYVLTPIVEPPAIAVLLNQTDFAPGHTLGMDLAMRNPGPLLTTDHYVGVILPDGQTVLWLTNTAPLEGVVTRLDADPRTFTPVLRNVSWPAGLDATQRDYLTYTFSGGEAPGTYHLLVGWTTPGSLADGRIDEGDVLALDWKAVRFTGPASTLAARD